MRRVVVSRRLWRGAGALLLVLSAGLSARTTVVQLQEQREERRMSCVRGNELRAAVVRGGQVVIREAAREFDLTPQQREEIVARIGRRIADDPGLQPRDC